MTNTEAARALRRHRDTWLRAEKAFWDVALDMLPRTARDLLPDTLLTRIEAAAFQEQEAARSE